MQHALHGKFAAGCDTSAVAPDLFQPLACCSYELFEEAFEIYRKFGLKQQAIKVRLG